MCETYTWLNTIVIACAVFWFTVQFGLLETRTPDGSLRCYQCEAKADDKDNICSLHNWKFSNITQKRDMIMQCPRRMSYFCHIVIQEGTNATIRGCSRGTYINGKEAHIGCFYMDTKRACLCDTNLCNSANYLSLEFNEILMVFALFLSINIPFMFNI